MRPPHLLVALLVAVSLAGCLSSPAPAPSNASSNTSDGNASFTNGSAPEPDDLPHIHSRWDNRSRRKLMEVEVPVEILRSGASADVPAGVQGCDTFEDRLQDTLEGCMGRAEFHVPQPDGDQTRIVPPGTATVEATVEWSDPAISGIHLQYQPAYRPGWRTLGTFADSGETVRMDATRYNPDWSFFPLDWTDDGHSSASRWLFAATAYAGDEPYAAAQGAITVTVHVERTDGELPLEPPHPDWYAGNATYDLGSMQWNISDPQVTWFYNQWEYRIPFFPQTPIPPGTRRIIVSVEHPNDSPTHQADPTRPEYTLRYATDGSFIWWDRSGAKTAPIVEETADRTLYEIPVDGQNSDSLYACDRGDTMWSFSLWVHSNRTYEDPFWGETSTVVHHDGPVRMDGVVTERTDGSEPADFEPGSPDYVPGCNEVKRYYQ